jgi:hypothetical protein
MVVFMRLLKSQRGYKALERLMQQRKILRYALGACRSQIPEKQKALKSKGLEL